MIRRIEDMNKALTFTTIFMGTVFTVFIMNIFLYAVVPEYHNLISSVVSPDEENIPVVEVNRAADTYEVTEPSEGKETAAAYSESSGRKETEPSLEYLRDEEVPMAESAVDAEKAASESNTATALQIINKEYHEDCGTGDGYWVITYSDGSVGIE